MYSCKFTVYSLFLKLLRTIICQFGSLLSFLDPEDYTSVVEDLIFSPSITQIGVPIPIVDDNVSEGPEDFLSTLRLVTTGAAVNVDPAEAAITIGDDDSEQII